MGCHPILQGLLVAIGGMSAVASGTIAFSCLYIGRWTIALMFGGACVILGWIFKTSYGWFMTSLNEKHNSNGDTADHLACE